MPNKCEKCGSEDLITLRKWPDVQLICGKCREFVVVPKDLMVRLDSLLSCLKHRHGTMLEGIGEYDEVSELSDSMKLYTR